MVKRRSQSHKRLQSKLAGRRGKKEVPIKVRSKIRRRDVMTPRKVYEIEKSGQPKRIKEALHRLQASKKPHKILKVPDRDLRKAVEIRGRSKITVSNLSSTKYR